MMSNSATEQQLDAILSAIKTECLTKKNNMSDMVHVFQEKKGECIYISSCKENKRKSKGKDKMILMDTDDEQQEEKPVVRRKRNK
jgi:hypothetical protein